MKVEVFVCPVHGQVPPPGPSGVCTQPQTRVIESRYVCSKKVVRHELDIDADAENDRLRDGCSPV